MAWYNNFGDFVGDVKSIATGHNPSNNAPPEPIPAGGPGSLPMAGGPVPTGQQVMSSTQPVYPNIPGLPDGSSPDGQSWWKTLLSKAPSWVIDGLKAGVPASIDWIKNNAGSIAQAGAIGDAVYREMQANKYAGNALSLATGAYNDKAPLRTAGLAGMLNPGANTPNLAALRSLAGAGSGNPFAKGLPMAGAQAVGNHGPGAPMPLPLAGAPGAPGALPNGNPTPVQAGRLTGLANKAAGIPYAGRLTGLLPKVS